MKGVVRGVVEREGKGGESDRGVTKGGGRRGRMGMRVRRV